jgi:hypothetical protein
MSNERFSDQPLIVGGPNDQMQPSRDPAWVRSIDRVLAVQRPLIVAYIRSLRRRYPSATPEQLIRVLERRYLTAVTSGGAAVGATAVVPGIGTSVTLALSGVETAGFLESTAIFAQSVAEVHGIAVSDPERARALVMTLMLGKAGTDLLQQFTGQAFHNGPARKVYWGEMITSSMPQMVMGPVTENGRDPAVRHRGRDRRRRQPHDGPTGRAGRAHQLRPAARGGASRTRADPPGRR